MLNKNIQLLSVVENQDFVFEKYHSANIPKPFIKWVGGKRQLLPELTKRLPSEPFSYFEPFIGGGALMWSLSCKDVNKIIINDFNPEISNLYTVVKNDPQKLIKDLERHYNDEDYYYQIRGLDRESSYRLVSNIKKASRFIFLNKTGYNGLYRVNSKGQNNVPYGKYKNPKIVDVDNILLCSEFLRDVKILNGDFEIIKDQLDKNSFVYLDPPYAPLSDTSNFTSYTQNGFDYSAQVRLKKFCDYIDRVGAKFMMSNSSSGEIYKLYKKYNIEEVSAKRAVNCKSSGRGNVTELIVRNYD